MVVTTNRLKANSDNISTQLSFDVIVSDEKTRNGTKAEATDHSKKLKKLVELAIMEMWNDDNLRK